MNPLNLLDRHSMFWAPLVLIAVFYVVLKSLRKQRILPKGHPPIIYIPPEEIFKNPREAYESALKKHGPVIAVYRKSRLEFIVNEQYTAEVLTNGAVFSFESGTLTIMNLNFILFLTRNYVRDMDKLINGGLVPSLNMIIQQIAPIFERNIGELTERAPQTSSKEAVSVTRFAEVVRRTMAEAMLTIIFGETYTSPTDIQAAEKIATDIAVVSGIYQNSGYWSRTFATTWRVLTWIQRIMFSIPWNFSMIGLRAWRDLRACKTGSMSHPHQNTLLHILAQRYSRQDGSGTTIMDTVWILGVTLGLLFASIHQTAIVIVWVVFELAVHPENIAVLREELNDVLEVDTESGKPTLTYSSLRKAERLDSFIREVMRTKGDTVSTMRLTMCDAAIGGYVIPKGQLVWPLATLSHRNPKYHGDNAEEFVSDRWVGRGKPAVMVSATYWPFGLGRFACPGRALAVAEIKLVVFLLIGRAIPLLDGNKYEIVDPMNVTSVPPVGQLLLRAARHIF